MRDQIFRIEETEDYATACGFVERGRRNRRERRKVRVEVLADMAEGEVALHLGRREADLDGPRENPPVYALLYFAGPPGSRSHDAWPVEMRVDWGERVVRWLGLRAGETPIVSAALHVRPTTTSFVALVMPKGKRARWGPRAMLRSMSDGTGGPESMTRLGLEGAVRADLHRSVSRGFGLGPGPGTMAMEQATGMEHLDQIAMVIESKDRLEAENVRLCGELERQGIPLPRPGGRQWTAGGLRVE